MTPVLPHRDVIDTFRGYRSWHGCDTEDNTQLVGMTHASSWLPGWTTAECASETHPDELAPKAGCTCGLYAWHLPDPMIGNDFAPGPDLFGVVEATDRIIRSSAGFKARKARIVAVYCKDTMRRRRIARHYPAVVTYADRDAMLTRFPSKTNPAEVYGPFGLQAQRLMLDVEHMTGREAHALDEPWVTWGSSSQDEYGSRVEAHLRTHGAVMGTRREYGVRSTVRPMSQVVSWARIALFGGDLIDDDTYHLLMDPWAKSHGDPLAGVARTPTGAVPSSGLHGPGGYQGEDYT